MADQENPDEGNVTSMMTEEMAERLTPWLGLAPDDHTNGRDLISMPARDILLSYLDNMSKNGQGEYTALLVTYSFPAYGFMVRKLQVLTTAFHKCYNALKNDSLVCSLQSVLGPVAC